METEQEPFLASSSSSTTRKPLSSWLQTFLASHHISKDVLKYSLLFVFAMIIHEIALEAASTQFSDLVGLSSAVTLFQFGFCLLLPVLMKGSKALEKFPRLRLVDFCPYVLLSLIIAGAQCSGTQAAVKYVSYPTKVVFKSAKLIPTMVVATVLHRKIYTMRDYIAAAFLCLGAAGYGYNGSIGADQNSNSWKGVVLLTISIILDAIVPNLQKQFMSAHPSSSEAMGSSSTTSSFIMKRKMSDLPSTRLDTASSEESPSDKKASNGGDDGVGSGLTATELMINVNAVGFCGLLGYMFIMGEVTATIYTATSDTRLLLYLVLVGLGLATSVFNYTNLIRTSGSVVAVTVATLRKVVTVVLSYVLFPKPLLGIHVMSGLLVLAGIVLSSIQQGRKGENR